MSNPALIDEAIGQVAADLDGMEKRIENANETFIEAEKLWLIVYDAVADTLKEEMVEEGRKGDPAEHTIVREARKMNREAWHRYRTAKKRSEALERQLKAKASALSGWQSQLKMATEEARAQQFSPRATQRFGSRAA